MNVPRATRGRRYVFVIRGESDMHKHLQVLLLGAAALGLAAPAWAITSTASVGVNITVAPTISVWADHATETLTLDGSHAPQNAHVVESGLNFINNVDARVDAQVTGSLPAPIGPGGGIQFYIFDNVTAATAYTNIAANQYAPAGAKTWNYGNLGASQLLIASVGINNVATHHLISYGASLPGDLPAPATWGLTVTYTMTNPP
jgi:hypothetical protein